MIILMLEHKTPLLLGGDTLITSFLPGTNILPHLTGNFGCYMGENEKLAGF